MNKIYYYMNLDTATSEFQITVDPNLYGAPQPWQNQMVQTLLGKKGNVLALLGRSYGMGKSMFYQQMAQAQGRAHRIKGKAPQMIIYDEVIHDKEIKTDELERRMRRFVNNRDLKL